MSSDAKFALSDENFLFECLGLTKTNSRELCRIFDRRIIDFLKSSELVQAGKASTLSGTSESDNFRPILDISAKEATDSGLGVSNFDIEAENNHLSPSMPDAPASDRYR